jgi:hypothetical protein
VVGRPADERLAGAPSVPALPEALVAASIGLGATLQALAGSWLVWRSVGYPASLGRVEDALRRIELAQDLATLEVTVRDTGIGIPARMQ